MRKPTFSLLSAQEVPQEVDSFVESFSQFLVEEAEALGSGRDKGVKSVFSSQKKVDCQQLQTQLKNLYRFIGFGYEKEVETVKEFEFLCVLALMYIDRVHPEGVFITPCKMYRLFFTMFVIASKFCLDGMDRILNFCSEKMGIVQKKMNNLESVALFSLGFDLAFSQEDYKEYASNLYLFFKSQGTDCPTIPLTFDNKHLSIPK